MIPDILAFRDKVAAHFAWSTENKRDSDAERLASIIPPLTFMDDAFYVGTCTVNVRSGGQSSDSSAMRPWSVTKAHKRLRERYWREPTAG